MAEESMPTWRGRPKLDIPVTGIQRTLIALSWIGVAISLLGTLIALHYLPAIIPAYINSESHPDGYGNTILLLIWPGATLLWNLIFALLFRIPAYRYIYPVLITIQNAERQYYLSKDFACALRLFIVWMLVLFNVPIIYDALHGKLNPAPGSIQVLFFLLGSFILILLYKVKAV